MYQKCNFAWKEKYLEEVKALYLIHVLYHRTFSHICVETQWTVWFMKLLLCIKSACNIKQSNFYLTSDCFLFQCLDSEIILCNLIKTIVFCLLHRLMQKEHRRMFFWKSARQLTLSWKGKRQHVLFQQKCSNGVYTTSPHVHLRVTAEMLFKAILLSGEVSGICACGMLF